MIMDIDFSKKHYVAWSGGCDSTLLLYNLCISIRKENLTRSHGNQLEMPTALVSKAYFIDGNKKHSEMIARDRFITKMQEEGMAFKVCTITTHVDGVPDFLYGRQGLAQPGLWVLNFLPYVNDYSVIHFGYIAEDSVWRHIHNFEEMINNFCIMLDRKIDIAYDLSGISKYGVISALMKYGILDTTWHCELPIDVYRACGRCNPCIVHSIAEDRLSKEKIQKLEEEQKLLLNDPELTLPQVNERLDRLNKSRLKLHAINVAMIKRDRNRQTKQAKSILKGRL